MGSANGRHRRPRQAPAIIVAAGVTGSAIAIPLLGAAGAHAADASTWDRVAECESGGMWSADLGNGYYGGLQLSQDSWSAYGGTAYASRADLASRSQQISVAEKILNDQGPKAWASCSVISGLVIDEALPGVDPGGEPSAEPSEQAEPSDTATPADGTADDAAGRAGESAGSTDEAGESGSTRGDKATGTDGTDSAAKGDAADRADEPEAPVSSASPSAPAPEASGAPDASQGTDETGGKHRGTPAPEATAPDADVDDGRESGRHASRSDAGARDGAERTDAGTYTVRQGDNLWAIADAQELPGGWTALYEANKAELGSDPDLILPGQNLDLDLQEDVESVVGN